MSSPQARSTAMIPRRVEARAVLFAAGLAVLSAVVTASTLLIAAQLGLSPVDAPLASLAMFLCVTTCVVIVAALVVRRALAPLRDLVSLSEKMTPARAHSADAESRDELEAIADGFIHLRTRMDQATRQINALTFVDPVTQLPNEGRFSRELNFYLLRRQAVDRGAAVILVDFVRLPRFLQSLDPIAAQDLLRAIGARFAASVRANQEAGGYSSAIAARLTGGEFAIFVPRVASATEASRFAGLQIAALDSPFEWRGQKIALGAQAGVVFAPLDAKTADVAIRHARLALGAAEVSPTRVKNYSPALNRDVEMSTAIEREMREGLARNEFHAFFQPKIDLPSGQLRACEALARWVRSDKTILSPARFIPVAEESGLIGQVSDAIMRDACWKAASWARMGYPIKVAVNVSAAQFRDDRFVPNVLNTLHQSGLAADHLELELTESVALAEPERVARLLQPLRDRGVRLAIDDFGCGHSSLASLSKLPFDVIKIDQQFVRALTGRQAQSVAIIDMILALGRAMNMDVVAEGVERREELDFLAARGCHSAQGFLIGAAVPAAEFVDLLKRRRRTVGAAAQNVA